MKKSAIKKWQKKIYRIAESCHRVFDWRSNPTPYAVLVSEFMLQQTQAKRVIRYFSLFIDRFPTIDALAATSFHEVLPYWIGLGYNRRVRALHQAAKAIVLLDKFPEDAAVLRSLPGIGEYTAAAILSFAFNKPSPFIETNVRTVYFHEFFHHRTDEKITERELFSLVTTTYDYENPRHWGYALMDVGAHYKQEGKGAQEKSAVYKKQGKFLGSLRYARGRILQYIITRGGGTLEEVTQCSWYNEKAFYSLVTDKFFSVTEEGVILIAHE